MAVNLSLPEPRYKLVVAVTIFPKAEAVFANLTPSARLA